MGFPVGYPEVLVPNVFLHALSLLAWLRSLVFSLFRLLRLSDLLDTDLSAAWPDPPPPPRAPTLSALLIREFLPSPPSATSPPPRPLRGAPSASASSAPRRKSGVWPTASTFSTAPAWTVGSITIRRRARSAGPPLSRITSSTNITSAYGQLLGFLSLRRGLHASL
ncbi:E3 ubiquitin-protein ligase RHA1B [Spatholobus suberectus]|nr:E3 ubiquitin-protein ligase RHA1B [Spatholobus suberectus]